MSFSVYLHTQSIYLERVYEKRSLCGISNDECWISFSAFFLFVHMFGLLSPKWSNSNKIGLTSKKERKKLSARFQTSHKKGFLFFQFNDLKARKSLFSFFLFCMVERSYRKTIETTNKRKKRRDFLSESLDNQMVFPSAHILRTNWSP